MYTDSRDYQLNLRRLRKLLALGSKYKTEVFSVRGVSWEDEDELEKPEGEACCLAVPNREAREECLCGRHVTRFSDFVYTKAGSDGEVRWCCETCGDAKIADGRCYLNRNSIPTAIAGVAERLRGPLSTVQEAFDSGWLS